MTIKQIFTYIWIWDDGLVATGNSLGVIFIWDSIFILLFVPLEPGIILAIAKVLTEQLAYQPRIVIFF